jgi:hypothetical protein
MKSGGPDGISVIAIAERQEIKRDVRGLNQSPISHQETKLVAPIGAPIDWPLWRTAKADWPIWRRNPSGG